MTTWESDICRHKSPSPRASHLLINWASFWLRHKNIACKKAHYTSISVALHQRTRNMNYQFKLASNKTLQSPLMGRNMKTPPQHSHLTLKVLGGGKMSLFPWMLYMDIYKEKRNFIYDDIYGVITELWPKDHVSWVFFDGGGAWTILPLSREARETRKALMTDAHCKVSQQILEKCKCWSLSRILVFATPRTVAPPGSSIHGILQARTLEWVAMPSSGGSSWPRDRTRVSCIAGGLLTKMQLGAQQTPTFHLGQA